MRYLGLDLGSRTCGIAMSDPFGMIASIYETFRFREDDYDSCASRVVEIIKKENIKTVVLGYPKHMNNDVGVRGLISEEFRKKIIDQIDVKVVLWDERTTTVEVNRIMLAANSSRKNRKEKKDELAAVIILQGYLDCKKED